MQLHQRLTQLVADVYSTSFGSFPLHQKYVIFLENMSQFLPNMENLSVHINCKSDCKCCDSSCENDRHCLFEFLVSSELWQNLPFGATLLNHQFTFFKDLFQCILSKRPQMDVVLFCCVTWKIWFARNFYVFEKKTYDCPNNFAA